MGAHITFALVPQKHVMTYINHLVHPLPPHPLAWEDFPDTFPPQFHLQLVKVTDKFMTYITLFHSNRGCYLHSVDVILILWISWIYPHFVDTICIGHITSYLACNVCPIFHIYSSGVSDWCITYFSVCTLICFSVTYSFCFVRFVG